MPRSGIRLASSVMPLQHDRFPLSSPRTAMAWKLFGRETTPAQLPAELRSILAQMQRERVAFEALTAGARAEGGSHQPAPVGRRAQVALRRRRYAHGPGARPLRHVRPRAATTGRIESRR